MDNVPEGVAAALSEEIENIEKKQSDLLDDIRRVLHTVRLVNNEESEENPEESPEYADFVKTLTDRAWYVFDSSEGPLRTQKLIELLMVAKDKHLVLGLAREYIQEVDQMKEQLQQVKHEIDETRKLDESLSTMIATLISNIEDQQEAERTSGAT